MNRIAFCFLICTILFNSCKVAEPVFVSNDNLEFKGVNDSIFQFTIDTNVFNPTKLKYQLEELFFDINYDGDKIGSGTLVTTTQVKPKDTVALPITCTLSLVQLQKKHAKILSQDVVDFYFTGEAFAVHPIKKIRKGFEVKIPYNARSFISESMLSSDLVFDQVEIEKINPFNGPNLLKSNFQLKIKFYNKQSFDFKIEEIQLSLKSKNTNKVVLEGSLDSVIDAPGMQTIQIPLDIESNNLNLMRNFGNFFLGNDDTKYIGAGSVTISIEGYDFQIPFLQEFDIMLNPFGSINTFPNQIRWEYCTIITPETHTFL